MLAETPVTGLIGKGNAKPAKKLVIKPLKVKPGLPSDFEETTWSKLLDFVQAVHSKRPVSASLEQLFQAVQDLCMHKMADRLYQRLQQACDAHVHSQVAELRSHAQLGAVAFLDHAAALWHDHCEAMLTVRQIFLYLDRTYVLTAPGVKSIFDMGLQLLRKHLDCHPQVEARVVEGMLALVERERAGDAVSRTLLRTLTRMFAGLGTYGAAVHAPLVAASTQHYQAEGDRLAMEMDVPTYLRHCEARLVEEAERASTYLDPSTRRPLVQVVEAQLLSRHITSLLDKGFAQLMDAHAVPDLSRLYTLCVRVCASDALRSAWKEYVRSTGLKLVKDEDKEKDMVEQLLEFRRKLEVVWSSAFAHNEQFGHALKEAFEFFMNARQTKPAELVAKFIDARLRAGGCKGMTEEEAEDCLDQALVLFRYIQGKDVFEAFYKKDLAKRLLLSKSASTDIEKTMIAKLKVECGAQFTTKLEGMFKDMDLSADVMTAFRSSSAARSLPPGVDIHVSVLTCGHWPTYPVLDARLPKELETYMTIFRDFYLSKYSGRRLVWQHVLGTCVLRAAFPKGLKELSVSLFQAVVLMLFNDAPRLTLAEIAAQSGIEDKELRRTLQSLACGKVRVLLKEPKGRDVNDGDAFTFNDGFVEKLFRIKINSIQMKETEEENKKTNEQVLQDRQYQIDAALVRIMKTRKTLSHKLLVAEALQQLRFPLKATDLKKRIESLIEREYMARDSADPNMYNYLA